MAGVTNSTDTTIVNPNNVSDGKVDNTSINSTVKKSIGTSALGKDAFMQLLVTQMQYQDPLNPSSDTDYIAQLATFSQLEQLQNLNTSYTNTQAMNIVGKTVKIQTTDKSGNEKYITGVVDFTTISNGTTKVSVGGNLYDSSQVCEVYDDTYVLQQGAPTVTGSKLEYDHEKPTDLKVKIDLGSTSVASSLAVLINNKAIAKENLSLEGNVLTIKADALKDLGKGKYEVVFAFDDPLGTIISDKVTVEVKGDPKPSADGDASGDDDKKDDTNGTDGTDKES